MYITWSLPPRNSENDIERIELGIGPYGTNLDFLPTITLNKDTVSYTADRLAPGTQFNVAIWTVNQNGESDPVTFQVETHDLPPGILIMVKYDIMNE